MDLCIASMLLSFMHKSVRHQTILPGVDAISIKSDRTFPRHSHDEFGFGYIVDGGQESWSGHGLVAAKAGDTITVNPAELHDGTGRDGHPRHWRMLYLAPAALAEFSDIPVESAEFSLPVNRSRRTLRLAVEAIKAVTLGQPDLEHAEQLVMLALAAQLTPNRSGDIPKTSLRSKDVQTVLDMICQDWGAPLSLADFATATNASKFQILRRFSRELGTTPHAYLTQHRVKRAKDMIMAGSSIADTAIACGFSDQSHLTRTFSRQLGLTPGCFARPAIH
ncbi:AraC family transcriptional regulator [Sedimentitalea sp. XS_ASV28]|uniref:helix-turn-helix transcriptional regulator n=1 Tax=Sedimentitalea sp. XS_ASV28 TaxID=3241296 RepID=UPI003517E479